MSAYIKAITTAAAAGVPEDYIRAQEILYAR